MLGTFLKLKATSRSGRLAQVFTVDSHWHSLPGTWAPFLTLPQKKMVEKLFATSYEVRHRVLV